MVSITKIIQCAYVSMYVYLKKYFFKLGENILGNNGSLRNWMQADGITLLQTFAQHLRSLPHACTLLALKT